MTKATEIIRRLDLLFARWKSERHFPDGHCHAVSLDVAKYGFPRVRGRFRLDAAMSGDGELNECHDWNIDNEGQIIDLTAAQFNSGLREENRVPLGILVIASTDPLSARYIPSDFQIR